MSNKTRSDAIEDLSETFTYVELVLLGSAMIAICATTIVGNALVLASFALDKKLRTLSNYFLLSLAVSDIMIATFSMPIFTAYFLIGEWTFGPALCNMWLSQDYTCSNASVLNLLMIAIDRYCSVTDPLGYRAKRTGKRVAIMIATVWIISFLLFPPWIYAWPYIEGRRTVPDDDCYIQFLETNTLATIITCVIDYYIPLMIILALYYRIWLETRRRRRYLADMETGYQAESICLQPQNSTGEKNNRELSPKRVRAHYPNGNSGHKSDKETEKDAAIALLSEAGSRDLQLTPASKTDDTSAEEKCSDSKISDNDSTFSGQSLQPPAPQKGGPKHDKAARVLTAILLVFIVTSIPYNVAVIIKNLDDENQTLVPDAAWSFFYYLFYINSTINPFCYALANENFRKTYWKILTCSWNRKPKGTYSVASYSSKSSESKISCSAKHATSSV